MDHAHPEHHQELVTRRELLKAGLSASAAAVVLPSPLLDALRRMEVASTPGRPHLDVARRAERWIARSAQRDAGKTAWPWNPLKPETVELSLYTGMPGVVLFYLELFHATGDRGALAEAVAGASHLAAALPASESARDAGLYTGLAGAVYTLEMTRRASGEKRLGEAARQTLSLLHSGAKAVGRGVEWSDSTDIISGSAGTGLFLLWAHEHMNDVASLDLAVRAGRRLVDRGEREGNGIKWMASPQIPRNYPNFSHGTAGVSYFLATLGQRTKDAGFLDAAKAGAAYLDGIATSTPGGGRMVFHSTPGNEQLFYLSWCHGPAGTARLYHRLASATGDGAYRARVGQLAQAILDMHVPERSPGFWNNISQCCGNCGVTEFFIDLHRVTKEQRHRAFAEHVAADTLQRATDSADGLAWSQAENRVQPDVLIAQTGLMQGAAGVGLAMLHLDGLGQNRQPVVVLPDNPFAQGA